MSFIEIVSVNPSKRTAAVVGVANLGVRIISAAREAGTVAVEAILTMRVVSAVDAAVGIIDAISISLVLIFVHVVPLVLHCIPGATPVSTSRAKSISKPAGAAAGPSGTSTTLTKDIGSVAVAALLTCTVIALFPRVSLGIVLAVSLVHVVPLSRLNSIAFDTPFIRSVEAWYVAFGAACLADTLTLRIADANWSLVLLTLT